MVRIMTTSIIRHGVILLVCGCLFSPRGSHAEDSPHWSKSSCEVCHTEAAPADGASLQAADAEALCESCHGGRGAAKACRHRSGIPAGDMKIDANLAPAIKNGQVVCSTCHDVAYQCKHARIEYSYQNPGFLRDRTTRRASEYCLRCHDASAYQALNPHEGVAGDPSRATCSLCHVGVPESDGKGGLHVAFNMQHDFIMQYDMNETCTGCHRVGPHPRNLFSREHSDEWVHLTIASADVAANMREAEREQGIRLPLNPDTGEIYCATCHNPHEFRGGPVAQQPKHRLRVDDICQVCHDK
jgi:predicted CXXCH cytochrome family protein